MMRLGLALGVVALVGVAGPGAWADGVPQALQGRWGMPNDCGKPGAGLTIGPDRMTMSDGGAQVTLMVDASEVHDGQARLTVKSVAGQPSRVPGPKPGDSLVLKRTGTELRPLEIMTSGTKRDISNEPPIGLCQ